MRAAWVATVAIAVVGVVPCQTAIASSPDEIEAALQNRPLDGAGNNVAHPGWGRAGRPYLRLTPSAYADGVSAPPGGPPTRRISNRIFADGAQNLFSENAVTQWGFVWGQFLDHTFGLREEAGGEPAAIAFDPGDPLELFRNDFGAIEFMRTPAAPGTGTGGVPREQVNTVSSYIDGSSVYSDSDARLAWLRDGPKLLLDADGNLPRRSARGDVAGAPEMALMGHITGQPAKAMVAGDVRANENIALAATHTLFAREHNRIVDALPAGLDPELKFQIARRVVAAEQQYITYREFLPALGVRLAPYTGYKPGVDATLSNEFAVVGYRAHSMIHGEIELEVDAGTYTAEELDAFEDAGIDVSDEGAHVELAVPLNLAFGNPDLLAGLGAGPVLAALSAESAYRNDEMIDNQLRSVLFQVPRPGMANPSLCLDGPLLPDCFAGVVDLGAIDVERGRDHGMPSYNALRAAYGLAPKTSFTAITGESTDAFPEGSGIDDPHSLDFVELRDIHGALLPADSDEAATAVRRSSLAARLKALYGTVDKVDAFVGMVSEAHVLGADFGELQLAIWRKQFEALRDGDRFFFLNDPVLEMIEREFGISAERTLAQVIADNTGETVPADAFRLEGAPAYDPHDDGIGGTVAATLSLQLGAAVDFGAFAPGVAHDYVASTTATVISTAGDAALTVADPSAVAPGHLVNGAFSLPQPLQASGGSGFGALPASLRTYDGPSSNDVVTVGFRQPVGATDALRTGVYAKTLTFTLSTTNP